MPQLGLPALLALAACSAAPSPSPPPPVVPRVLLLELRDCPGKVPAAPAPQPPRTVEAVARWAVQINDALVRTEQHRADCARRLERLVDLLTAAGP